jgi:hypothetical protein
VISWECALRIDLRLLGFREVAMPGIQVRRETMSDVAKDQSGACNLPEFWMTILIFSFGGRKRM